MSYTYQIFMREFDAYKGSARNICSDYSEFIKNIDEDPERFNNYIEYLSDRYSFSSLFLFALETLAKNDEKSIGFVKDAFEKTDVLIGKSNYKLMDIFNEFYVDWFNSYFSGKEKCCDFEDVTEITSDFKAFECHEIRELMSEQNKFFGRDSDKVSFECLCGLLHLELPSSITKEFIDRFAEAVAEDSATENKMRISGLCGPSLFVPFAFFELKKYIDVIRVKGTEGVSSSVERYSDIDRYYLDKYVLPAGEVLATVLSAFFSDEQNIRYTRYRIEKQGLSQLAKQYYDYMKLSDIVLEINRVHKYRTDYNEMAKEMLNILDQKNQKPSELELFNYIRKKIKDIPSYAFRAEKITYFFDVESDKKQILYYLLILLYCSEEIDKASDLLLNHYDSMKNYSFIFQVIVSRCILESKDYYIASALFGNLMSFNFDEESIARNYIDKVESFFKLFEEDNAIFLNIKIGSDSYDESISQKTWKEFILGNDYISGLLKELERVKLNNGFRIGDDYFARQLSYYILGMSRQEIDLVLMGIREGFHDDKQFHLLEIETRLEGLKVWDYYNKTVATYLKGLYFNESLKLVLPELYSRVFGLMKTNINKCINEFNEARENFDYNDESGSEKLDKSVESLTGIIAMFSMSNREEIIKNIDKLQKDFIDSNNLPQDTDLFDNLDAEVHNKIIDLLVTSAYAYDYLKIKYEEEIKGNNSSEEKPNLDFSAATITLTKCLETITRDVFEKSVITSNDINNNINPNDKVRLFYKGRKSNRVELGTSVSLLKDKPDLYVHDNETLSEEGTDLYINKAWRNQKFFNLEKLEDLSNTNIRVKTNAPGEPNGIIKDVNFKKADPEHNRMLLAAGLMYIAQNYRNPSAHRITELQTYEECKEIMLNNQKMLLVLLYIL